MAIRGVGNMDQVGCEEFMTYLSSLTRGTDEDKAVKVSSNDTVALVAAGENFDGVARTIQSDGLAGVQEEGYAELEYTGSDPSVGQVFLIGGSSNGKVAVADENTIKVVTVTVEAEASSGASAADPDLVGGTEIGVVSNTNQDQLVDNVAIDGTGAVTVTLAAAATAQNKFDVSVLKAQAKWPKRYLVRSVDTVNKKVTIKL